jgi:hypothetical protein
MSWNVDDTNTRSTRDARRAPCVVTPALIIRCILPVIITLRKADSTYSDSSVAWDSTDPRNVDNLIECMPDSAIAWRGSKASRSINHTFTNLARISGSQLESVLP